MLPCLPLSILKTWYLYSPLAFYVTPAILTSFFVLEPEEPEESTFARASFYFVAIVSCALTFYYLLFQARYRKRAATLIGALVLWQSLVAFYNWQHPVCRHRSKLWNWAFGSGHFECPRPRAHHISLKFLLEFTVEILWTPIELLTRCAVKLYKAHFGGGWLDPGAWIRWIFLVGTTYMFFYTGNGNGLVPLLNRIPGFNNSKVGGWIETAWNLLM